MRDVILYMSMSLDGSLAATVSTRGSRPPKALN
jgi:hypothetical protein